jgi:hypothetical protein
MLKWPTALRAMMIKHFLTLIFLGCSVLFAQTTSFDRQVWTGASVDFKEIRKLDLGVTFQSRFDRNAQRLRGNYLTAEASYKLGKGFRFLGAVRGATSPRWDKLRFSTGISKNFDLGKTTTLKIRSLWQYQVFSGSEPRYGLNVPQHNFRLRVSIKQKIARKTWITLQSEPLWRKEASVVALNRLRTSLHIERTLPGPWSVTLGYMNQLGFNNSSNAHVLLASVGYELKFKPKRME